MEISKLQDILENLNEINQSDDYYSDWESRQEEDMDTIFYHVDSKVTPALKFLTEELIALKKTHTEQQKLIAEQQKLIAQLLQK